MQNDTKPIVLLVDDEKAILDGLVLTLRREPYEILTAVSAFDALQLLERHKVRVVVSDERMPDMPGSEFLRHVKRRWPNIMRILLTGEVGLESTLRAIRDGELYRFLCKPLGAGDLATTLRQALNVQQMLGGLK